jgi:hypothetical protein
LLIFSFNLGQLTEKTTSIRAVTLTRRIVIGTRGGEICEIEKDGRIRVPIQGLIIIIFCATINLFQKKTIFQVIQKEKCGVYVLIQKNMKFVL